MAALLASPGGALPARGGKVRGAGTEENARAAGFALGGLTEVERRGVLLGLCYRDLRVARGTKVLNPNRVPEQARTGQSCPCR